MNIKSAKYGANNKFIEVTEIVLNELKKSNSLKVCNKLFSDPLLGIVKELIIEYEDKSIEKVKEGNIYTTKIIEQTINKKILWVPEKNIDLQIINNKILECVKTKHFTNGGINVITLQDNIKKMFNIDEENNVLVVCNGAMGINLLVGGLNIFYKKTLKWAVQAFTFPCSNQGLMIDSIIMDLDENMGPNIKELEERKDEYDGILVTNCFGCSSNIELYETFCKKNNKLLLFDNAAASFTYYNEKNHLNYGDGCMVSLHHTKPIGFSEGGFIVFNKKYLETFKRTLCFGYTDIDKINYDKYASNYKMSEITAIYINNYLLNLEKIYKHHTKITEYFIEKLKENNLSDEISIFNSFSKYNESLLACIPILFKYKTDTDFFIKNNIEAKKYYYPIDKVCKKSLELYEKIICLPLNIDINEGSIDYYIKNISNFIKNKKKIKFRIFTPEFNTNCGGITVLYVLARELNILGFESKIITFSGSCPINIIYNNYTNKDDVNDCIIIYPEIVRGNPLKVKKIIRWMLCDLGKNCDINIYKSWNKTDIIYYYSSYTSAKNNIKYLNCVHIYEKYKNYNLNNRNNSCYEYRKAHKFHKNIVSLHNKNDINLDKNNIVNIFNNSKYYYCYDPYTYNMVLAGLCGCIPIIYPIAGMSKKEWTDSLYCKDYLKSLNKDFMYGIAYGIEDLKYAQETIHLLPDEQYNIKNFINLSVKKMCDDIMNEAYFTVADIFY